MWITEPVIRLRSFNRIRKELGKSSQKIALVGQDKHAGRLDKYFRRYSRYWGIVKFTESDEGRIYTDLAFEDLENFVIVFSDGDLTRNHEEKLIEIGFNVNQFLHHCFFGVGSRLNYYDYLIGYTKKCRDGLPGYTFFPPSEGIKAEEDCYTILILGGSTSDPGTGNVISWPECLYNEIRRYYDNVRVICAGVVSHVASQELFKLIRDGYLFSPDLVISFSGVNDFSDHYQDNKNPFVLRYTKRILPKVAKKNILNEKDVTYDRVGFLDSLYWKIVVKEYSFGVDAPTPISRADHWIRCEKMMHAISHSIGADFIGILQPQNFADFEDPKVIVRNPNYAEAKKKLSESTEEWLLDFTDVFEGQDNVFYDNCHVYGFGNRIIAKKILPYAIKAIKEKQGK